MVSRMCSVFKDFLSTPHTASFVEIHSTTDLLSRSVLNPTRRISSLTSHPSAFSYPIPCGYILKETSKYPTHMHTDFTADFCFNLFHYFIFFLNLSSISAGGWWGAEKEIRNMKDETKNGYTWAAER